MAGTGTGPVRRQAHRAWPRQRLARSLTPEQIAAIARGGYVLMDTASDKIDAILIGTGSEVSLAVEATASPMPATVSFTLSAAPESVAVTPLPLLMLPSLWARL